MKKQYRQFFKSGVLLLGIGSILAACQTPTGWHKEVGRNINAELKQAGAQTGPGGEVPAEVKAALLPPLELELGRSQAGDLLERRFDLAVNNAPTQQVFMSLVENTPYSMVVDPGIKGRISVKLQNVTVEEALKIIRRTHGYDYRRQGAQFTVYGRGLQTRMYPVNYLNLVRQSTSSTQVSSGQLGSGTSTGDASSTSTSTGGNSVVSVTTSTSVNFWQELGTTLTSMIGNGNGRSIIVNPQANLVIVRAYPKEHALIEDYLHLTQDVINRQVILEAKIIEVNLSSAYQTGINWSKVATSNGTTVTASQVGGGSIFSGTDVTNISGTSLTLDPNSGSFSPTGGTATTAFGGVFAVAAAAGSFSVFLEALKLQGEVQVLSSPRVSTVNNQKAVIKVGADEFFITSVSTSESTSGSTTTSTPSVELSPFFSGIALDVTPQIDKNGNIILHMHPTVSDVTQKNKSFTIQGNAFDLPLALTNIQETDNIVRSNSGQIIVIGGLMKEASTDNSASVPLLGDIPLLGKLFRHKKITRIKKELVILLRPTILNMGQEWNQDIEAARGRAEKILR